MGAQLSRIEKGVKKLEKITADVYDKEQDILERLLDTPPGDTEAVAALKQELADLHADTDWLKDSTRNERTQRILDKAAAASPPAA